MNKKSLTKINSNDNREEFTKTEEINGITTRMNVEKVSNGYIVTVSKYGYDKTKKNSEYVDVTSRYISTSNPLEAEEKISLKEEINNALKNIKL